MSTIDLYQLCKEVYMAVDNFYNCTVRICMAKLIGNLLNLNVSSCLTADSRWTEDNIWVTEETGRAPALQRVIVGWIVRLWTLQQVAYGC